MKAAIHKYHKGNTVDTADVDMEDASPLPSHSKPKSGKEKAPSNGTNGHHAVSGELMSEDEGPIASVNGKKRKLPPSSPLEASPPSESDDDRPLASSSPVKRAALAASQITKRGSNARRVTNGVSYREEDSSDDDKPLLLSQTASTLNQTPTPKRPVRKKARIVEESDESDDDLPLSVATSASPMKQAAPPDDSDEDDELGDDDSDAPVAKKKAKKPKAAASSKAPVKRRKVKEEETSPVTKKEKGQAKQKAREKKATDSPRKKAKKEEEDEDIFKWWEANEAASQGVDGDGVDPSAEDVHGDGTAKWKTLVHSGVLFPPPYEALPSTVKFYYDGKAIDLPPEVEEIAYFFAKLLGGEHVNDPTFQKNFFRDFTAALKQYPPRDGTKVSTFTKCDFRKIYDHIVAEKEAKKSWTKDQKKAEKERQNQLEEKFKTCLLDGRKEKVGNFRVEPPGLFLGRGDHPKKGSLKLRLRPEDIVINIGKDATVPTPNVPGQWRQIVNDNTVTWLANWKENINGNFKYVFLAASSSLKGQSDMNKFEKARELKKHVARIRQDYQVDLRSRIMADRQRATAMYFIDKLALRAGNEKGEDEADTVGCCSLRCEHVTLDPPNKLVFDFLGKDSIRYYNSVEVELQVFRNIRIFKENKNDDDALFDRVTTGGLNKHLQDYMKGLTAKVFRTYNASITLQEQLDGDTPKTDSVMEKLAAYNKANRMVAILCNHQRAVSKNHGESMAKMGDKLKGLKYDRMKLRHALFVIEPKKKKSAKYAELESDLDDDFIAHWEDALCEKEIEKAKKKFEKENASRVADGAKAQDDDVLEESIKSIKQEYKRLAKERGTNKAELKRAKTAEKLEENIETIDEKIKNFKIQMGDKEEGKQVALGTSKINYLDPRITAAWCAEQDVPISKIFSKSLLQKFPWAMGVKAGWKF